MQMQCPFCDSELELFDYFGRIASHQDGKVLGDIYKCPNGAEQGNCESSTFHVAGSFYIYRSNPDTLHEGYPC